MMLDDLNLTGNQVHQKEAVSSWPSLAKILAAVGTVGGMLLHLIGYIGHESYLTAWGIDPGLFPKPVDEVLMTGYMAIMDRSVSIFTVIETEAQKLLGLGMAIAAYVFVLLRLSKSDKREKALRLLQRVPEWINDLAKSLGVTAVVLASFPVALFIALFFMVIPPIFGDSFGHSLAEKEYKTYLGGCNQVTGSNKCFELRKDGKIFAHGFLIDSSATHIALFDVTEMRARAVERAGTEYVAYKSRKVTDGTQSNNPKGSTNKSD